MEISLNYTELAFIMALKRDWCRQAFMKILNVKELNGNDEIPLQQLTGLFKPIKSVDPKYDGMNELLFAIQAKRELYKNELDSKSARRYKKFTGAKTIFYKICTEEQLQHAAAVFENRNATIQTKIDFINEY